MISREYVRIVGTRNMFGLTLGQTKLKAIVDHLEKTKVNEKRNKKLLHDWQLDVSMLFATISDWIKKAEAQNVITLETKQITLDEDPYGPYEIQQLYIKTKLRTAVATPVGMNIVGCKGRVDFKSHFGTSQVLRTRHGHWDILPQELFRHKCSVYEFDRELVAFNCDSFADILRTLILGS
jgi:hypothetical protein